MADDIQVTPGATGPFVRAEEIGAKLFQAAKMWFGALGSATPVSAVDPLPTYTPGGIRAVGANPFNRPANTTPAYAVGSLVANHGTAASVVPMTFASACRAGEVFRAERMRLRKSGPSLTNASFRVYLFRAQPVINVGDKGVFNASGALAIDDIQYMVDWFDITMDRAGVGGARGAGVPHLGSGVSVTPADGTTLYALIEALGAYTPLSGETFNATLEGQCS